MLSIIIPVYNEARFGLDLGVRAVLKVRPKCEHEFIFVNDLSTDGSLKVLKGILKGKPGVRIVRNSIRLGTAGCRNAGAAVAKGDVFCFLDAHVWPDPLFFDYLYETALNRPMEIIAPGITQHNIRIVDPFPPFPEKRSTNWGGSFTFAYKKFWFYMSVNKRPRDFVRRRGTYACGMTMTRKLFDHLDGWMRLPGYWSSSDVAMCIKMWLMDLPITIDCRAHHFHGIKGFRAHETPKNHEVLNRVYAARVLFSEEYFRNFWWPGLSSKFGLRRWSVANDKLLASPEVVAEHQHIRERCVLSDDAFLETIVYPRLDKYGIPRDPRVK